MFSSDEMMKKVPKQGSFPAPTSNMKRIKHTPSMEEQKRLIKCSSCMEKMFWFSLM
jgi:hypothetical protein